MTFPIWLKCSEEAADDTNGGSARPAKAREPKPSAERQAKKQQQRQQESAGHPPLIPSTHPFVHHAFLTN